MGGVLENMLQASDALGLEAACFRDDNDGVGSNAYFTVAVTSPASEALSCDSFTSHPLFKRHTNRFPYMSHPIPPEVALGIAELSEGKAHLRVLDAPSEIETIASAARQASEIRFQTQEVHECLARSLRFTKNQAARDDGLDIATIPLPPGGSFFLRFIMDWKWMSRLNRLGAYKLMANLDVNLLEEAPAVIAVVGGSSREEVIDAGRLLVRAWIDLNSRGIAVHPYYVVSDQLQRRREGKISSHLGTQADGIAKEIAALLNLSKDQCVHMLLRIGYPTKDPVRSKRLPLKAVCCGISGP